MHVFDSPAGKQEPVGDVVGRAPGERLLGGGADLLPVFRMDRREKRLEGLSELPRLDLEDAVGFIGPAQAAECAVVLPVAEVRHALGFS